MPESLQQKSEAISMALMAYCVYGRKLGQWRKRGHDGGVYLEEYVDIVSAQCVKVFSKAMVACDKDDSRLGN